MRTVVRAGLAGAAVSAATIAAVVPSGAATAAPSSSVLSASSARVSAATLAPAASATTVTARLVGAPRVGSVLRCAASSNRRGGSYSYRWFVGGTQFAGAQTFSPTLSYLGKSITCQATVMFSDTSRSAKSTPAVVAPGLLVVTGGPGIKKSSRSAFVKVGAKLTAVLGTWGPGAPDLRVTYVWKRDGKVVVGRKAVYVTSRKDRKHKITLVVTATRKGYATRSVSSAVVHVV